MILLDTHAWIWWATEQTDLSRAAAAAIAEAREVGVSVVSCWEVARLVERGRLRLGIDVLDWVRAALALDGSRLVPLTPEIAVRAARLPREFPGDPMDRIIAASAVEHRTALVTKDVRMTGLEGLRTVW